MSWVYCAQHWVSVTRKAGLYTGSFCFIGAVARNSSASRNKLLFYEQLGAPGFLNKYSQQHMHALGFQPKKALQASRENSVAGVTCEVEKWV